MNNFSYYSTGGGGSVMVWAAFSCIGKSSIRFCKPKMKSVDYQNVMEKHLLPLWLHSDQSHTIYQQDNAPIHKSASIRQWLEENGIDVMEWPPCSSDLNPIENLWGILVRVI